MSNHRFALEVGTGSFLFGDDDKEILDKRWYVEINKAIQIVFDNPEDADQLHQYLLEANELVEDAETILFKYKVEIDPETEQLRYVSTIDLAKRHSDKIKGN